MYSNLSFFACCLASLVYLSSITIGLMIISDRVTGNIILIIYVRADTKIEAWKSFLFLTKYCPHCCHDAPQRCCKSHRVAVSGNLEWKVHKQHDRLYIAWPDKSSKRPGILCYSLNFAAICWMVLSPKHFIGGWTPDRSHEIDCLIINNSLIIVNILGWYIYIS